MGGGCVCVCVRARACCVLLAGSLWGKEGEEAGELSRFEAGWVTLRVVRFGV